MSRDDPHEEQKEKPAMKLARLTLWETLVYFLSEAIQALLVSALG